MSDRAWTTAILALGRPRPDLASSAGGRPGRLRPARRRAGRHPGAMLAFVDAHPDALWRSCAEGHLTGSALVVDAAAERVLLLFHRKVRRWLQPGGHVDGDANLAGVALREATEETGIEGLRVVVPAIDLDIHEFRRRRASPTTSTSTSASWCWPRPGRWCGATTSPRRCAG